MVHRGEWQCLGSGASKTQRGALEQLTALEEACSVAMLANCPGVNTSPSAHSHLPHSITECQVGTMHPVASGAPGDDPARSHLCSPEQIM